MNTPSVEPIQRSRLLPRVTFRAMFAITTIGAFLAAIGRVAGLGTPGNAQAMATGVLVSVGFLAVCLAVFAIFFLIAWLVSILWYRPADELVEGSPFADDQLPPQILPPRDRQP
ncbi:hypothetical protein [Rubripirellula obstinata]|nr:hypothetical protein [Rubripirellula obstinata]